ncbi:hypothetical protein [Corallococcus terminator]|nr:hypothetical protein [Corallococcus terminator]
MTDEELVEAFVRNAAAQTEAVWTREAKAGNEHAGRYITAFKK